MDKYKKLFNNTAIFAISQFSSKILVFFMLPLYTGYLSAVEYGTVDMISTTISLLMPILTLQISLSAFRFLFDNRDYLHEIIKFSAFICLAGFALVCGFTPVLRMLNTFDGYEWYFAFLYAVMVLDTLLGEIARGLGEIKLVGILGVMKTFINVALNILLLVICKVGVDGYFCANIASFLCSVLVYGFVIKGKASARKITDIDAKSLRFGMLRYSIPMIPNSLSWWLITSLNRYIINGFCGIAHLGIYSAASKIPTILSTFQSIFSEALVLSIVEEYNTDDSESYFSQLYTMYNIVMVIAASGIILFTKLLSYFLLSNEFYDGWKYVPFLIIAVVFGGMAGYVGTFYSASKENKGMFYSTAVGGLISLGMSFLLVPRIGPLGSALAHMLANMTIWLYRLIDTTKFVKLNLNLSKDATAYILLAVQSAILIFGSGNGLLSYGIQVLILGLLVWLYHTEVLFVLKNVWTLVRKKTVK